MSLVSKILEIYQPKKQDNDGWLGTGGVFQAGTATKAGAVVEDWLAGAINTPNTTLYDKAIDSVYLAEGTGGSKLHHLVDGQHDLFGAFEAAKDAASDDSLWQEVLGTAAHLSKDLFSKMGLPVFSVDAESYRAGSDWIAGTLGISKDWQADFLQINGMELFGGMLAATCTVMGVRGGDAAKLAEIGASTGLASLVAANPIAMAAACVALVLAFQRKKQGGAGELAEGAAIGAGTSAAVLLTGTALGGIAGLGVAPMAVSFLLTLIVGMAARQLISHHAKAFRNPKLALTQWKSHIQRWLPSCEFSFLT